MGLRHLLLQSMFVSFTYSESACQYVLIMLCLLLSDSVSCLINQSFHLLDISVKYKLSDAVHINPYLGHFFSELLAGSVSLSVLCFVKTSTFFPLIVTCTAVLCSLLSFCTSELTI